MSLNLDSKLNRVGGWLPRALLHSLVRRSVGRRHVALMFHRVRTPRPEDINSGLCVAEQDLDAIVAFLLAAFPARTERWLTITFDDGYEDAVAYVESRASKFRGVDFILFVSPQKTEWGIGFRWDLAESLRQSGAPKQRIAEVFRAPQDVAAENDREDLRRVAQDPQFQLASVDRLRRLGELPNVSIGNHTNCHFDMSLLTPEHARLELEQSWGAFERLFGSQRHFAFPYGHGFFDESHLRILRSLGDSVLWGTGQSPYEPSERVPGGLVPRVGLDGVAQFRGAAAIVAGRSVATRVFGVRPVARPGKRRMG